MKYLFSISFLFIYLVGTFHSSWTLIDFYWHRDDYTQKYCRFLDEGITRCRASCYLEYRLKEEQQNTNEAKISSEEPYKITELSNRDIPNLNLLKKTIRHSVTYVADYYRLELPHFVFHPPKFIHV